MIGDRHVHSCFSFDSQAKVEDILDTAVGKGMKEICFTDHCDFDLGPDWIMPLSQYTAAMEKYKEEYAGRIDIHIGVEIGLNPEADKEINSFLASYPFDFVIGSVHTMLGDDPYFRRNYKMDDRTFYRTYFETVLYRLKAENPIDAFGHFDYVIRYGEFKADQYDPEENAEMIEEILQILIDRDIALELNTGGLRKGLDFVHPHCRILDRYKEMGGRKVTVGSDAHIAADIGSGFEKAEALIKEYGFQIPEYR